MELQVKKFSELSTEELYEILRLRVSVFVVEQKCPYMETDDLDQNALHMYFRDADGIKAYLRIIDKSDTREYVTIGRVISVKRRRGIGTELVREGIAWRWRCSAQIRYTLRRRSMLSRFMRIWVLSGYPMNSLKTEFRM